jgi:hypothetical protein
MSLKPSLAISNCSHILLINICPCIPLTPKKQAGEAKKDKAQLEHDASHASATLGGYSVSASGVAKNDPNRSEGSWNQTVGSAKAAVGGLVGSEVCL